MSDQPVHRAALPQGTRVGEFEFHRVLGAGGFGLTYLGWNVTLDVPVAIKEYLPVDLAVRDADLSVAPRSSRDEADFAWGLERFLSEARLLARFKHPNIVQIYHFFLAHGTGYIVMEYVEGETLAERLELKGRLSEQELTATLLPILDGLEQVHAADFLHRDIKPGNIVIRADGSPVLLDFGAARQAVGAKSRSVTSIVTPGYAPIEQYSTKGNQGPWTDIYALAAIGYRALTGEMPSDATERVRRDPLVPAVVAGNGLASKTLLQAIDWGLAVDGEARPQSVAAWRAALLGQTEARDGSMRDPSHVVGTIPGAPLPGIGAEHDSVGQSARNDPQSLARRERESMSRSTASTRSAGSSRWLWFSTAAAAAVLAVALSFSDLLGSARELGGVSEQERLQDYTQAKRLEGEIQALQERITQSARAIEQEVRDAESEVRRLEALEAESVGTQLQAAATTLAELRDIADLEQRVVYASPRLAALQGELNAGMALVDQRGANNARAVELLEGARAGYQQLLAHLQAAPAAVRARNRTVSSEQDFVGSAPSLLASSRKVQELAAGREAAEAALREGRVEQAATAFQALADAWEPLSRSARELDAARDAALAEQARFDDSVRAAQAEAAAGEAAAGELAAAERAVTSGEWTLAVQRFAAAGEGYRELNENTAARVASRRRAEAVRLAGEMVAIPGGTFRMGCLDGDSDCWSDEKPVHAVTIQSFRLGKYEVTFEQYDRFAEATGRAKPGDEGWGRGNRPVINVSWDDAQAYARWVSEQTGQRYRLPTEAEWEYAARAGTTTVYSWGNGAGRGNANCNGCESQWDGRQTAPVGTFAKNQFGLHDMHGNVLEWVEDCWNDSYNGAPSNGSAWTSGECSRRVLRGGSWRNSPDDLRSAFRRVRAASNRYDYVGFRLAQDTR